MPDTTLYPDNIEVRLERLWRKVKISLRKRYKRWKRKSTPNNGWLPRTPSFSFSFFGKLNLAEDGQKGWYFNFFTWSVLFRIVGSITIGAAVAISIKLLTAIVVWMTPLSENPVNWYVTLLLAVLLGALFAQSDQREGKSDALDVPETKFAALLLLFGIALRFYLRTSNYPWIGSRFGFSRSTKVAAPFTDENGFLKMGEIQFRVWDESDAAVDSAERRLITAPAKNEAEIKAALTLIVRLVDPRLVVDSDDAGLDLGDRARQEWRELVTRFNDTDIPKLHAVMGNLFKGQTLITSFIGKSIAGHKTGSIIRNKSGEVMFELVKKNGHSTAAAKKFIKRMLKEADEKMLEAITITENIDDGKGGKVETVSWLTQAVTVQNPIHQVLDAIGGELVRISIADIDFAQKVKDAAEQASAEQNERIAQLESAETIRAVRKKLMPDADEVGNPSFELATILSAAQDDKNGNIKVIMVPGGNSLASAAIAGASQIGGNS